MPAQQATAESRSKSKTAKSTAKGKSAPARRTGSWRELAVARSLDPARERAEKRVQRFLDAALDLMTTTDGRDFTVQEVVERSGQSLRSFYQYFAGKHELLLALLEESVRGSADRLRTSLADVDDPLVRLERFCVDLYRMCQPPSKARSSSTSRKTAASQALAEFTQQLLTEHPKEAAGAFEPMVELLSEILVDATKDGAVRPGVDGGQLVGVILQAVMFNTFALTIAGSPLPSNPRDAGEELWDFILHGLAAADAPSSPSKTTRKH